MQRYNVRMAYVLIGLVGAVSLTGCAGLHCERYVAKNQTLSVGSVKGQIAALTHVDVNDIRFDNQFPTVSGDVIFRDQAQYQACVAINDMSDGPLKEATKQKYVDQLLDILKATAAQNPGAVSVPPKPDVKSQPVAPKTTTIDIAQPIVNQPRASYPQVKLQAGQTVDITANGCVQTGGAGRTWKRYVDPDPADKYYATITVAGLYSDTPLRDVIGKPFVVPAGANGHDLILGYVDDNYSDNGYYSHDDGTNNQCQGVGPASVKVTVTTP